MGRRGIKKRRSTITGGETPRRDSARIGNRGPSRPGKKRGR
jgi:hypothetical protein